MLVESVHDFVVGQRYAILRGNATFRVAFELRAVDGDYLSVKVDGKEGLAQLNATKALRRGVVAL